MSRTSTTPICFTVYQEERDTLTEKQIDAILLAGRAWDLSHTLATGGVAVFPHTYLASCGPYIAACVHGALDSGADHVLALGVLHSFSDVLYAARESEKAGNFSSSPLRGVHGPRMRRGDYWKDEYSLLSFVFLLKEESKRRGIKAPKLSLRFPYLVNRQPESLPGINELEAIAKNACLVATSDFCHHGVAYGNPKEQTLTGSAGCMYAKQSIQEHLNILQAGDLPAFYKHCQKICSDSFDVAPVLHHLRGPLCPKVLDVAIVDTAPLYEVASHPSWVAASLVLLEKRFV